MLARGHHDAEPRAGSDVDMRIDAALADELQSGQAFQERRPDRGAFADQHQRFGVGKAGREYIDVLDMIVPDGDVMAVELAKARQGPHGVMVVVQDGDFHEMRFPSSKNTGLMPVLRCGGMPEVSLWFSVRRKAMVVWRRHVNIKLACDGCQLA